MPKTFQQHHAGGDGPLHPRLPQDMGQRDSQGEHVRCLLARADVRVLAGAWALMEQKGWPTVLCVIVFGFLHLVYHAHAVALILALLLGHPEMREGFSKEGVVRAL